MKILLLLLLLWYRVVVILAVRINSFEYPTACNFDSIDDCRIHIESGLLNALKGKSIFMFGDSITRYQYMSLRHSRAPAYWMNPSIVTENHWNGWINFFKGSNGLLEPYGQCDCSYYSGRFFEIRTYHDPLNKITVRYTQYRGFFVEGSNETNSLYSPEPQSLSAPKWGKSVFDYLETYPHKPDVMITNVGMFPFHESVDPVKYINACKRVAPVVVWKTSSYRNGEGNPNYVDDKDRNRKTMNSVDQSLCNQSGIECFDISWTKFSNASMYWDSIHFNNPVYIMMNSQLLSALRKWKVSTSQ